jgi:hypothetical protein
MTLILWDVLTAELTVTQEIPELKLHKMWFNSSFIITSISEAYTKYHYNGLLTN